MNTKERDELLQALQTRFEANMRRHAELDWADVLARLTAAPDAREQQLCDAILRQSRTRCIDLRGQLSLEELGAAIEQAATGQPMLLAALGTAAGYGWYLVSRPFDAGQPAPAPTMEVQTLAAPAVDLVKQELQPGVREFNAPPPPAQDDRDFVQSNEHQSS